MAVLLILLVAVSAVYADSSLLKSSILSCTYQELVEIGTAYGLDTQVSENTLRQEILDYFDLDGSEEGESTSQEAKAEDVTSIQIEHSDRMDSVGDLVVLSGGVRVKFTSAQTGERILTANYVAIDLGHKILQASGDVILEDESGTQRTFRGQVVSLDWSSLDVVVFDGISTTTRTNSSGKEILFYVSGNEVSYDGESSGVFFRDGTIATWPDNPYWSISAKKLSLSGNDLFFDRAVFRLGRVPIFYFPVFFYPGTTLSFNPSIGMSSTKGAFMTTTYEVYGQYPRLGVLGTKSSNSNTNTNEVDASDVSGLTSFFDSDDDSTMVHDGLYYRPLKDGEELSPTEKWARESGSFLAVFADVYQNLGLSMGVDTLNKFLDKKLSIGAIGVAAYNPYRYEINMRRFRYSFDFNLDFSKDNLKVTAALPMRSDPAVRVDYLNRNTAFALDSLLGVEQFFPATYKSQSTYTWLVDSSYKMSVGNFNFSISSLKADVDYKLDLVKDEDWNYYYKPTVVEASLPYLNFSSDGVFVNLKGQSKKTTKDIGYSNDLAKSFFDQQAALSEELEDVSEDNANVTGIKPYSGPDLLLEQTSVSQAASLKIGYTYNQTLDNIYKTDLAHDNFYTKINSTVYLDASAPDQWLQ
ncbi:MAG: LPS-assembly protein LptD, partial [Spirochaetales bacterium]|nr:LPS-assembly protein LptD [Spirochaetales bacterium]